VQRGILSKERKAQGRRPDQNMSDALTDLRERGEVPWEWIVDETRSLDDYRGASTLREWMLDVLPGARLDPWLVLHRSFLPRAARWWVSNADLSTTTSF